MVRHIRCGKTAQCSGAGATRSKASPGLAGLGCLRGSMPIHSSVSRNEFHFTRSLRQGGVANLEQNSSALFSKGARRVPPQRRRRALVKMPNFQQIQQKENISEIGPGRAPAFFFIRRIHRNSAHYCHAPLPAVCPTSCTAEFAGTRHPFRPIAFTRHQIRWLSDLDPLSTPCRDARWTAPSRLAAICIVNGPP